MFDVEFGCDGFVVVAYAAGVGAFYDAFDGLGQFNFEFLNYCVVFDNVD